MPDETELLAALTRGMTDEEIAELAKAINEAPPPKPEADRADYRRRKRAEARRKSQNKKL